MDLINVEIKAKCPNPESVRTALRRRNARFAGMDHQVDTYFRVPQGRLKLRQGNIENNLIAYRRPEHSGPKTSDVALAPVTNAHLSCQGAMRNLRTIFLKDAAPQGELRQGFQKGA